MKAIGEIHDEFYCLPLPQYFVAKLSEEGLPTYQSLTIYICGYLINSDFESQEEISNPFCCAKLPAIN